MVFDRVQYEESWVTEIRSYGWNLEKFASSCVSIQSTMKLLGQSLGVGSGGKISTDLRLPIAAAASFEMLNSKSSCSPISLTMISFTFGDMIIQLT